MKTITILIFLFITYQSFAQEKKSSFFKSIKFTALGIGELGGQWRPFEKEEDKWYNQPSYNVKEEDIPHGFFSFGTDLQANYMIDNAAFVGVGYQNQQYTDTDMLAPLNTYYLHFRTGDDFDSQFCLYVELDLGLCMMRKYVEGIMYRATLGMDFNFMKFPYFTPTVNFYLGQRVLANVSTVKHSGGFYNVYGISAGFRIN